MEGLINLVEQAGYGGRLAAHHRMSTVGLGEKQEIVRQRGQPGDLVLGVRDRIDEVLPGSVRADRRFQFGLQHSERGT